MNLYSNRTIHDIYIATDSGVRASALWNMFWLRVCVDVCLFLHLVGQNGGGSEAYTSYSES